MANQGIKLGDKVEDTITGFKGIAVGCTAWLMGCDRIGVQSQCLKDGKPVDLVWFDISQLKLVEEAPEQEKKTTGGPRPDPSR